MSLTMLAVAVGAIAAAAAQGPRQLPPEMPVVALDGAPGTLGILSQTPPRPPPLATLPVTRLDETGLAPQLDQPRAVSLTFARPLPVREVLLLLFRGTPFSVVVDPAAEGTFAGELKDVTLRQALESVLHPAGLDYATEAGILRVFPRRAHTRLFPVDRLAAPRGGLDYFAEIGAGVQALLSATGTHHVNRSAAVVQVTDFADRLDLVAEYLETAQVRTLRQVRMHARIFEVTGAAAGPIEWAAVASRPGSGVRRPSTDAPGWRVDDVAAWQRTIAGLGAVRHIASPALLMTSNEPATLRAVDRARGSELTLTLTAQVSADRMVHVHVAPAYAEEHATAGAAGGGFAASVDTVLRMADGDTILIGGLLRTHDAGVAELVVLLTATVVVPEAPAPGGGSRP